MIVILGIFAVAAAPQFFNFGGDARESTLRGLQGSMNAGADLVYARAANDEAEGVAAMLAVLNIAPSDWDYSYAAQGELRIAPPGRNATVTATNLSRIESCFVSYSPATEASQRPDISVNKSGC